MSLTLTKLAETATTITLGWSPVPGATGYRFTAEKQAKPSHTWDPARSSVRFAKGSAWYRVEALAVAASGEYRPDAAPPPDPAPAPATTYPSGSPYPAGSFWNPGRAIARDAAVEPSSAAYVAALLKGGYPWVFNTVRWTVATTVVKGGERRYDVSVTKYGPAYPDGGNVLRGVPIPAGTRPDPAGDGHLCILDFGAGYEYQLWQAVYDSATDRWSAGSASRIPLDARAVPAGCVGAYDANFPLMAGVVTPEELASGRIEHPLIYATPNRRTGPPRCPATANAGNISDPDALPNGAWFALDPSLDVDALTLPAWQKTIARALQDYGMFCRDGSSGSHDLSGENTINRDPTAWQRLFGWTGNQTLSSSFPWTRLRALRPPC
jgi:hypothetical protein